MAADTLTVCSDSNSQIDVDRNNAVRLLRLSGKKTYWSLLPINLLSSSPFIYLPLIYQSSSIICQSSIFIIYLYLFVLSIYLSIYLIYLLSRLSLSFFSLFLARNYSCLVIGYLQWFVVRTLMRHWKYWGSFTQSEYWLFSYMCKAHGKLIPWCSLSFCATLFSLRSWLNGMGHKVLLMNLNQVANYSCITDPHTEWVLINP